MSSSRTDFRIDKQTTAEEVKMIPKGAKVYLASNLVNLALLKYIPQDITAVRFISAVSKQALDALPQHIKTVVLKPKYVGSQIYQIVNEMPDHIENIYYDSSTNNVIRQNSLNLITPLHSNIGDFFSIKQAISGYENRPKQLIRTTITTALNPNVDGSAYNKNQSGNKRKTVPSSGNVATELENKNNVSENKTKQMRLTDTQEKFFKQNLTPTNSNTNNSNTTTDHPTKKQQPSH
jgi:hypothetical protein